jgi:hypothetical protein
MVVAGTYVRIILNPNLVTFSCIGILYGGLDEWPVNTEISGNHVAICRVGNIPEHGTCTSLHIKVDIWHPAVGFSYRNPPRHLGQLKTRAIP